MSRAVLVLADLYPVSGALPDLGSVRRMPALERCLARADSYSLGNDGWRGWLRERLGAPPPAVDAPGHWLATPVHYIAGLDTLRLHGDGLLRLPLSVQEMLVEEFGRVFVGADWQLMTTGARELLLRGPQLAAEAPDPASVLGQSVRDAQPRGAGVEALRQLQSEIEMWLHTADFHGMASGAQRRVNGLWLWGRSFAAPPGTGEADDAQRAGKPRAHLIADDLAACLCAAAAGATHSALAQQWPVNTPGNGDLYVVINVAGADVTAQLEEFVARWFMPAVADCATGRFATLELVCGTRRWQLDNAARWRFWRRPRHWLPELLAC